MTISERKAWELQQRRERIIDMAEAVFLKAGYENTTLPAIADAAGYNKRTLYLYFKDKEEIFLAVVFRCLTRLHAALKAVGDRTRPEGIDLRRLANAFFDFSVHDPGDVDLIMIFESRFFIYHGRQPPAESRTYLERCQQVSDDIAQMVTNAIAAGIAAGKISNDLTPRQHMLLLWGQIFGVMKVLRMREKNFKAAFGIDRKALFDRFVAMVERALAP